VQDAAIAVLARFATGVEVVDPARNPDLHGNVPERSAAALLIVDVLNALRFEGSEAFVPRALEVGRRIVALKERARQRGVPSIYVNDNAGRWRSDLEHLILDCTKNDAPGRELTRLLAPTSDDYVVLKPKHSGFYSTTLDTLLTYVRARRVILTGLTTERCLLFTANDAFLRDYELFVPRDCTAAIDDDDHAAALRLLERVLHADTTPSESLDFDVLVRP
jgi:nicotinamidase-related amidase